MNVRKDSSTVSKAICADLEELPSLAHVPGRFGAKTANLAHIAAMTKGLRIPEGFAISTDAFRGSLASNADAWQLVMAIEREIETFLNAPSRDNLTCEEVCEFAESLAPQISDLQTSIANSQIPEQTRCAIERSYRNLCKKCHDNDVPLAVRSSATAERHGGHSFAGRYDSFLNQMGLEQVLSAVKGCWASLYNIRAIEYQIGLRLDSLRQGDDRFRLSSIDMSVLVLRSIEAGAAGTSFSINKLNGQQGITVYANYGLGEAVVGGNIIADCWVFESPRGPLIMERCGTRSADARQFCRREHGGGARPASAAAQALHHKKPSSQCRSQDKGDQ